MKLKSLIFVSARLTLLAAILAQTQEPVARVHAQTVGAADTVKQRVVMETYGKLPLSFEANQGQVFPAPGSENTQ